MTPKAIITFTLLIGVCVFAYSLRLDLYTDQKAKDKLDQEMTNNLSADDYRKAKNHYYEELEKIKTNKTNILDFGAGLRDLK